MGLFDFWKKKDATSVPTPQPTNTPTQPPADFGVPTNPTIQSGPNPPVDTTPQPYQPQGVPGAPVSTTPDVTTPVNPSVSGGFENKTVDGFNKVDGQGPTQPPQQQ